MNTQFISGLNQLAAVDDMAKFHNGGFMGMNRMAHHNSFCVPAGHVASFANDTNGLTNNISHQGVLPLTVVQQQMPMTPNLRHSTNMINHLGNAVNQLPESTPISVLSVMSTGSMYGNNNSKWKR